MPNSTSIGEIKSQGHAEVVNLLLDDRVEPNAETTNGDTPLHLAAFKNHHKVVRLLLDSPRVSTANHLNCSQAVVAGYNSSSARMLCRSFSTIQKFVSVQENSMWNAFYSRGVQTSEPTLKRSN